MARTMAIVFLAMLFSTISGVQHVHGSVFEKIIVIVNGVDNYLTSKHTIEDHLLVLASDLGITVSEDRDSKTRWARISREDQLRVFKSILERSVEEYFKPQVEGLKLLITLS